MSKYVPLYVVRNIRTGALYTPVPVDGETALRVSEGESIHHNHMLWPSFVGYGIPYVGVFRR
jgi:hypothetical protein